MLTIETLEIGPKYCSGVFMVNFNDISHLLLPFLLLNLSMYVFVGGDLFMKRKLSDVLLSEPETLA